ncbi:hypothetical protein AB0L05_27935 [Nonomuraea pusilla]|uniref:hypothetical protein n=1 Tax=Nonomuraea pusilla TaxID=46177 RepID=UPI0033258564
MTGPEHFQEAEKLLRDATMAGPARVAECLAAAQAHATLALAAATATALQAALSLIGDDHQVTEWGQAIGATLDTNQGARIASALYLIDEWEQNGLISADATLELRRVLGTGGEG